MTPYQKRWEMLGMVSHLGLSIYFFIYGGITIMHQDYWTGCGLALGSMLFFGSFMFSYARFMKWTKEDGEDDDSDGDDNVDIDPRPDDPEEINLRRLRERQLL